MTSKRLRTTDLHCYSMLTLKVSIDWSNPISFGDKVPETNLAFPSSHGWPVISLNLGPVLFPLRHAIPENTGGDVNSYSLPSNDLKPNYTDHHNNAWDLKSRFPFMKQPYVSVLCWSTWSLKITGIKGYVILLMPWFLSVLTHQCFLSIWPSYCKPFAKIVFKCKKNDPLFKAPSWLFTSMNLDLMHD